MGPYYFTFFVFVLISLTAVILYLQIGSNRENIVPVLICPEGCKNGKCNGDKNCFECDPLNRKCCCHDSHCKNCIDNIYPETGPTTKENKYIKNENEYIVKLNEKIKRINQNINN